MSNSTIYLGPHIQIGSNTYELAPIPITARESIGFGGTFQEPPLSSTDPFQVGRILLGEVINELANKLFDVDENYISVIAALPNTVEHEVSAAKNAAAAQGNTPEEKLDRVRAGIELRIAESTTLLQRQSAIANAYYGIDTTTSTWPVPPGVPANRGYFAEKWVESYRAAYEAKILIEKARLLNLALATVHEERLLVDPQAAEKVKQDHIDGINFISTMNERILQQYGEKISEISKALQSDVSGKKIRSYHEAMATFEKIRKNPRLHLNSQDSKAVVDALKALDKATFADNLKRLARGFGVIGNVFQAGAIYDKTVFGFEHGDWKPLLLELEAFAVGLGAQALIAFTAAVATPVLASTTLGIISIALTMAVVASFINADSANLINDYLLQ